MKKRRFKTHTILLMLGSFIGLSLLLYPTFSNFWNQNFATHVIDSYVKNIDNLDEGIYRAIWDDAIAYNRTLLDREEIIAGDYPLTLFTCDLSGSNRVTVRLKQ